MKKFKIFFGMILMITFLFWGNMAFTGELIWQNSRKAAFEKARAEKKKVLLFGGRESCGNCRYMRTQVFETMKPPVKALLEKHYVLWFSDIDNSTEWYRYAAGFKQIELPLICVIDPDSVKTYEDRTTGRQHSPGFYSMISKHFKK
jgi:thioredoxin-related protein